MSIRRNDAHHNWTLGQEFYGRTKPYSEMAFEHRMNRNPSSASPQSAA
jgi:hypothetical protein